MVWNDGFLSRVADADDDWSQDSGNGVIVKEALVVRLDDNVRSGHFGISI